MDRPTQRLRLLALLAALALAGAAQPARALSISGIAVAPTGANSAAELSNAGANRAQIASSTALTGSTPGPVADVVGATVSFDARYAALVAVDREAGAGTTARTATASYTITFTVDNPLGGDYRVDIDTSRIGALTLVSDAGGASGASASLGAVTGLVDGVADAALTLPAVPALTGNAGGDQGFSQTGAVLSLFDSAPSRTFTLTFSWTASASGSRDEAAVRLGIGGALTGVSADDYPGVGGRTASSDGHFVGVGVTLLTVPEPGTLALLGGGLAALAARRRGRAAR